MIIDNGTAVNFQTRYIQNTFTQCLLYDVIDGLANDVFDILHVLFCHALQADAKRGLPGTAIIPM